MWLVGFLGHTGQLRSGVASCSTDRLPCWTYEGYHFGVTSHIMCCVHYSGPDVPVADSAFEFS